MFLLFNGSYQAFSSRCKWGIALPARVIYIYSAPIIILFSLWIHFLFCFNKCKKWWIPWYLVSKPWYKSFLNTWNSWLGIHYQKLNDAKNMSQYTYMYNLITEVGSRYNTITLISKSSLMAYAYMQSCIYFFDCLGSPCNMLKFFMGTPKIPCTVSYAHFKG